MKVKSIQGGAIKILFDNGSTGWFFFNGDKCTSISVNQTIDGFQKEIKIIINAKEFQIEMEEKND